MLARSLWDPAQRGRGQTFWLEMSLTTQYGCIASSRTHLPAPPPQKKHLSLMPQGKSVLKPNQ